MKALGAAVALGVVNALVFLGFEWLVEHGTNGIWNDLAGSDTTRWLVVPLAIAGSLALSLAARAVRQRRVVTVHTDPLHAHEEHEPATVTTVAATLGVGLVSLVGGASLGPEAPLAAASMALGELFARGQALVLASVGALLVAFFGSLLPIVIPLLLLYQRKRLTFATALPPIVTGLAAFATLKAFSDSGYGSLPADTHFDLGDVALALGLGALAVVAAAWLKRATERFERRTRALDERLPWAASASLFGLGLGVLYLVGGQSVQFSGSDGVHLLLSDHRDDTTLMLLGLAAVKLLATGWCLACGYRGGPVFPTVYVGVAVSLSLGSLAGPGATIGAITGILTALTNPAVGVVMTLSLLPLKLWVIGLAGAAGAIGARRVLTPPG